MWDVPLHGRKPWSNHWNNNRDVRNLEQTRYRRSLIESSLSCICQGSINHFGRTLTAFPGRFGSRWSMSESPRRRRYRKMAESLCPLGHVALSNTNISPILPPVPPLLHAPRPSEMLALQNGGASNSSEELDSEKRYIRNARDRARLFAIDTIYT